MAATREPAVTGDFVGARRLVAKPPIFQAGTDDVTCAARVLRLGEELAQAPGIERPVRVHSG